MIGNQYIDHLIGIYIDSLLSISNDAGWSGESMLARLIAFHGEIPEPTRNDQSNVAMIKAVETLRGEHAELNYIKCAIKTMLGDPELSHKIIALLSRNYYRGLNSETGACYTDTDRIKRIGYAPMGDDSEKAWDGAQRRFRRRVKEAYTALEQLLYKNTVKSLTG